MRRAALACLTAAVVSFSRAPTSAAQPRDPAAAEALFRAAKAAVDWGDLAAACAKFGESQRLDPAPGTLFNLADCEERRGKLATAWGLFDELTHKLPPDDPRMATVRDRASALQSRLPKLTLVLAAGAPAGAAIRRDDVVVGEGSLGTALPVDPGHHRITITAPGRRAKTIDVEIAEGVSKKVEVVPGDEASGGHDEAAGSGTGQRTAGLIVGGVGVAAMAAGVGIGLAAKGSYDGAAGCTGELCDARGIETREDARRNGTIATVVFGVGAGALVAGAVLWFTAPSGPAPRAQLGLGPRGAFARGTW